MRLTQSLRTLFFLGTFAAGTIGSADRFWRGEVDGNGSVDLTDAVIILEYLFLGAKPPACLDAADADDDGEITLTDGIFVLSYLFLGSVAPPRPSPTTPCPGEDPTPDALDCSAGVAPSSRRPTLLLRPVFSNAPGIRQRSRLTLPLNVPTGRYLAPAGTSFTIVAEATSHPITQAGFSLSGKDADPATLRVLSDRPLGEPSTGGVPAGWNLAPFFFGEVDVWVDPIYLVQEAALRVDAQGSLAPRPGIYQFTGTIMDDACAQSEEVSFELEVFPSDAPDLLAWIEKSPEPLGEPQPHDAATGNPRVRPDEEFLLVVEARPNGLSGSVSDLETLRVTSVPSLAANDELSGFFDVTSTPDRRSWRVVSESPLSPGNVRFEIAAGSTAGGRRAIPFVLEVEVEFEQHVRPILTVNCTGCHERPDPEKGLELVVPSAPSLTVWRNMVNVFATEPEITSSAPILVRPLFPERSYLFHKLRGTHLDGMVGGEGDRMPQDAINFLGLEEMAIIQGWIEQGALR